MKQTWWEASHTEVTCFVVLLCNINHAKRKLDTKYLSRDKVCLCPTRFLARKTIDGFCKLHRADMLDKV